jgi:CMP-N-acetylneuraminic acid synthetase
MKHYAIIPARAGSKSIINKNIKMLGNRSLYRWTLDAAIAMPFFERIFITTDILLIVKEHQQTDRISIRNRDASLCTDTALMHDVIKDVIKTFKLNGGFFWLLQPTCPFRQGFHFYEIKRLIQEYKLSSVISVKQCQDDHPNRCYTIKKGKLYPLRYSNFKNKQDLMPIYRRNGSFYVCDIDKFIAQDQYLLEPCSPLVMDPKYSINIDSQFDFDQAVYMVEHKVCR